MYCGRTKVRRQLASVFGLVYGLRDIYPREIQRHGK